MSKEWYYQLMGSEFGPITSVELRKKAQRGEIAPDTLVRMGSAGRWIDASGVKGLFDAPQAATPVQPPMARPLRAPDDSRSDDRFDRSTAVDGAKKTDGKPVERPRPDNFEATFSDADREEKLEHHESNEEYEFFRFVGFRQAISERLYAEIDDYRLKHGLTITQVTRKALAELVGKPELADDPPPSAAAEETEVKQTADDDAEPNVAQAGAE